MKIAYYLETDSMYIDLSEKGSVESKEISPGVVLDYDSDGNIAGVKSLLARKSLDSPRTKCGRNDGRTQLQ